MATAGTVNNIRSAHTDNFRTLHVSKLRIVVSPCVNQGLDEQTLQTTATVEDAVCLTRVSTKIRRTTRSSRRSRNIRARGVQQSVGQHDGREDP